MKRELKFRAWDGVINKMITWDEVKCERFSELERTDKLYLMQFTGLNDKNEVEIYEGDYCIANFITKSGILGIKGHIVMDEFMWCLKTEDEIYSINRITNVLIYSNIYQHPELLETKKAQLSEPKVEEGTESVAQAKNIA